MAFPQVASSTSDNSAGNALTHTVTVHAGTIAAGQLLLVFFSNDGAGVTASVTTPATGWTRLVDLQVNNTTSSARMSVFYRWADGGEATTITVTTSASEGSAYTSYRITGADSGTNPEATTDNSPTSTTPEPPVLDPAGWASEDTLWFVGYGWDGNVAHTSYPTDYASNQLTNRWANTGGSGVASASRELAASSVTPGTAVIASSEQWGAVTVGIRPGAAGTDAAAENATGTGAASGGTTAVAPTSNVSTGTGTANAAKANVGPSAGNAAATGAASQATTKVAPTVNVATATGTASNPSGSVKATAGHAAGAGSASDATVSTAQATSADAGLASGTGAASDATVSVAPVVAAATATGAAAGITAKVSPVIPAATGTGTSFDATATTGSVVSASAGVATGTGSASPARISLAATAGHVFGTGAALGPDVSLAIPAGAAAGSGAAFDATISLAAAFIVGGAGPRGYAIGTQPGGHGTAPAVIGTALSPRAGGTATTLKPRR